MVFFSFRDSFLLFLELIAVSHQGIFNVNVIILSIINIRPNFYVENRSILSGFHPVLKDIWQINYNSD